MQGNLEAKIVAKCCSMNCARSSVGWIFHSHPNHQLRYYIAKENNLEFDEVTLKRSWRKLLENAYKTKKKE